MKIVHYFAGRVNPEAAKVGSVHVLSYLTKAQVETGHQVDWYLVPRKSDYENFGPMANIYDFGRARFFGLLPPLSLFKKIIVNRGNIDLVHLHGPFTQENILAAGLLKVLGIPYCISSHGSFAPEAMKGRYLLKLLYKHLITIFICNSAKILHVHTLEEAGQAKAFGCAGNPVVAEHGADHILDTYFKVGVDGFDKPPMLQDDVFNMLFLGRLDPWQKGLDVLLDAVSKLSVKSSPIKLWLIGPEKSRYAGYLDKKIEQLDLSRYVEILPPIYDLKEKISWYRNVNLFVHPSRFDVFPIAIYEALAGGCPVLVTPGTQAGEFVKNCGVGVCSKLDADDIAEEVFSMVSSGSVMPFEREKCKASIREYTWERAWGILYKAFIDE